VQRQLEGDLNERLKSPQHPAPIRVCVTKFSSVSYSVEWFARSLPVWTAASAFVGASAFRNRHGLPTSARHAITGPVTSVNAGNSKWGKPNENFPPYFAVSWMTWMIIYLDF